MTTFFTPLAKSRRYDQNLHVIWK